MNTLYCIVVPLSAKRNIYTEDECILGTYWLIKDKKVHLITTTQVYSNGIVDAWRNHF